MRDLGDRWDEAQSVPHAHEARPEKNHTQCNYLSLSNIATTCFTVLSVYIRYHDRTDTEYETHSIRSEMAPSQSPPRGT